MDSPARPLGIKGLADVAWLLGYVVFALVSIGFFLKTQAMYPLVNGNDPVYLGTVAVSMAIICGTLFLLRRRIFTGDARQPLLMWVLILGVAIPLTAAALGGVLFINGALDRGPALRQTGTVVSEADEPRNRHYMLALSGDPTGKPVKLELKASEGLEVPVGGQVTLEIMHGRLSRRWVRAHIP